jgi:putative addiction module component (TIGR02574 family)
MRSGKIGKLQEFAQMNDLLAELFKLSPAERIQLAEDLWDSVAAEPEKLEPLSDAQRAEIERRLAEHDRKPGSAATWLDVRARLWSRVG